MIVSVNMSREVFEYYKGYDLSDVANTLLEQYDFTALPPTSGKREIERTINVTDPVYIQLYKTVGPRSKKVSLGRLFEFGFNMDVLNRPNFRVEPTKTNKDNLVYPLIDKAYRALLKAQKFVSDEFRLKDLKEITDLVYNFREVIK
jgi:hypothetical protein